MEKKFKELVEAAKELNEVLGLSPAIKLVGIERSELETKLKEAAGLIDPDADEITPETVSVLKSLGAWPKDTEPEPESKPVPKEPKGKVQQSKKPEEKKKEDKKAGAKKATGTRTKKAVVEEMLVKGATIEQMAQKITDEGIDPDYDKNCLVVKLWLQKMGFDTKKDAIKNNPVFKAK